MERGKLSNVENNSRPFADEALDSTELQLRQVETAILLAFIQAQPSSNVRSGVEFYADIEAIDRMTGEVNRKRVIF